ncbi:MAG: hypothetical protein ACBZ72_09385 [Candidatus Bathyarchaeia archaeon]
MVTLKFRLLNVAVMQKKNSVSLLVVGFFCVALILSGCGQVLAWSNGGYSADPATPDYGTHDWIAQHALG